MSGWVFKPIKWFRRCLRDEHELVYAWGPPQAQAGAQYCKDRLFLLGSSCLNLVLVGAGGLVLPLRWHSDSSSKLVNGLPLDLTVSTTA
jgi:hypothetical protein